MVLGVVLGGRLGYVLFYQPVMYFHHPLKVFFVWDGGMSFHGGMLGVFTAAGWFAWKTRRTFFKITDFVAPIVPIGLFFGRIGNFINGELPGRVADVSWAMNYPHIDMLPRHPSVLYEAALEGLALFAILWIYAAREASPYPDCALRPRRTAPLPRWRRIALDSRMAYKMRQVLNAEGKRRIAAAVARAIPDYASLFITLGTTTNEAARALASHHGLRVIMANARKVFLLADASKRDRNALVRAGHIADNIHALFTDDHHPPLPLAGVLAEAGVAVHVADS